MATEEKEKDEKKAIPFILLDDSVLINGLRALVSGVDIKQFKRNSVMFYYHVDYQLPIGRWTNIRKEDGKILADAEFDYEDTDAEVQRIIGKVERGFLRMASVDLRDLELSDDEKYKIKGQTEPTVVKSRLREASIVPIGGNHNAFRLYDKEGIEIDLSDSLKLSDFVKPYKQENKMNKELLTVLKLSDDATPSQVTEKVNLLLSDNATLKGDNATLITEKEALQGKLDAIALADKEAKKAEFTTELEASFKDGRLDNDKEGKTKDRWVKLFDVAPEMTLDNLKDLPKRESAAQKLSNDGATGGNAFAEREKAINDKRNKK